MHNQGQLWPMVRDDKYEYDLLVIGGGSGGLACSKVCYYSQYFDEYV